MKHVLLAGVLTSLLGCGDEPVPAARPLSGLTAAEVDTLCEELVADFPARITQCTGFDLVIGVPEPACQNYPAPATCTATVGDLRACMSAWFALSQAELCALDDAPAECLVVTSTACQTR
ncbi:MAG: hypothetical protein KBG28_18155 [Kofleriaceae bacterium]|jgi:hypothetical protein|nr:hypothetical protein [Kofleriaceae bacterium]MBP6836666.1 hypothetical protein [Kofleriaceae bacterium]MBP9205904.1 hypothetical protein [Kofleriaceae bacterium]